MKIHLGGSLAWYDKQKRSNFVVELSGSMSLNALLDKLAIPSAEIAIISINGQLLRGEDYMLKDTDEIKLYPSMGGG